jgi:hypothetical protein
LIGAYLLKTEIFLIELNRICGYNQTPRASKQKEEDNDNLVKPIFMTPYRHAKTAVASYFANNKCCFVGKCSVQIQP